MGYAERFLGGRGIATQLYWEEVGPGVGTPTPISRRLRHWKILVFLIL